MGKNNGLRDKLDDDTLDLSLMQMQEVPVEEIAAITKGTTVDLSNNYLIALPENFPTLTHIVKLDLSKNRLAELPEYFGQLKNLRHLDLYSNQLERLPVSFADLKNLKWLDLKNNPLVPALAQAAGNCITKSDCAQCAKNVVILMQSLQTRLEMERQKVIIEEQKQANARKAAEDAERERIKAKKRAAKERRREEAAFAARQKEVEDAAFNQLSNQNGDRDFSCDRPANGAKANGRHIDEKRGWGSANDSKSSRSCFGSILSFLLGFVLVGLAAGVSLLWIYTGGNLDERSIKRAAPLIKSDMEKLALDLSKKTQTALNDLDPYMKNFKESLIHYGDLAWKKQQALAHYTNKHLGPYFCDTVKTVKDQWNRNAKPALLELWRQIVELWTKTIAPFVAELWTTTILPALITAYEFTSEKASLASEWLAKNGPVYIDYVYKRALIYYQYITLTVDDWING